MKSKLKIVSIPIRILAFLIDYLVITAYMACLYGVSTFINDIWPFWAKMENSYILSHTIAFFSLTVPVFLYFFLMESSRYRGTLGKRILKIRVSDDKGDKPERKNLFLRNFLKFLPWEINHTIMFLNSGSFQEGDISTSLLFLLSSPLIILLIYFLFIVFRKDNRSLYDLWSNTVLTREKN